MIYEINIKTFNSEALDVEKVYGTKNAINRTKEIINCDNVLAVDVIDCKTGVVLLTVVENDGVTWIDKDFAIVLASEIILKNF